MNHYATPALTSQQLAAYAQRIGHGGPLAADLATLQHLHRLHPQALPFENLDSFLGRPVDISLPRIFTKLVEQGRGGYCFEHNGLLAAVLTTLGFEVSAHAARVLWDQGPDVHVPLTHMVLHVAVPGAGLHLVDAGFGRLSLSAPLRLTAGEQHTPHETYRVEERAGQVWLAARVGGSWRYLYRHALQPAQWCDFVQMNWYVSTHPESRFVNNLIAARIDGDRRNTLLNNRVTIRHGDERIEQRVFTRGAELRACLEKEFALRMPEEPQIDARLAALCRV